MKKTFTLMAMTILLFIAGVTTAGPVDKSKALLVAQNFWNSRSQGNATLTQGALEQVTLSWDGFYVFRNRNGKGFVIVSADDCVSPVLGYSFTNDFCDADNMSPELSFWLDGYQQRIDHCRTTGVTASEQTLNEWQRLLESDAVAPVRTTNTSVSPLLTTNWGQGSPYNAYCPIADDSLGYHVQTGCVATAMAMIMKYYNYPHRGTGYHAYYPDGFDLCEADFGNTVYDYDNMPDSIGSYSDSLQIDAVAKLMYHCGVAVEMMYGLYGSGAYISPMPYVHRANTLNAMISHFGYSFNAKHLRRNYISDSEWVNILKSQLDASQPVIYMGCSIISAHCFVCDGYDENDFFHINWGWHGTSNGFYSLDSMPPYNYRHEIIVDLVPHGDDDSLCIIRLFPYTMDFEYAPNGWTATDDRNDNISWSIEYLSYINNHHHSSAYILTKNYTQPDVIADTISDTLYTPAIVTPGHYIISWQDRTRKPATVEYYTLLANSTMIAECSDVDTAWSEHQAFFDVNEGDTVHLAFCYFGTFDLSDGVIIDNIIIYPEYMSGIESEYEQAAVLHLFPNPTTGIVTLQSDATLERIDITDISGRLLRTIYNPSAQFDIGGLPRGVYFVKFTASEGVCVRKVVKQ